LEQRQRSGRTPPGGTSPLLCVRHVLAVRAAERGPGRLAAELAGRQAGVLLAELAEAFRKSTWQFRAESQGPEAAAWLRAAAFLDGSVYGGCPPPGAPGQLRPWGSR
jgi:hypothetical protein